MRGLCLRPTLPNSKDTTNPHALSLKWHFNNLKIASAELEKNWDTLEKRLSVVNGKDLITLLNSWVKERYKQSISRTKLLSALKPDDISEEMKKVIDLIIS